MDALGWEASGGHGPSIDGSATTSTDDALAAAVSGDSVSFAALYESHLPQVFRYLRARVDDPNEAADLAQLVFLRAWEALPRYRPGRAPFAAWLFTIARNAAIDSARRSRATVELEAAQSRAEGWEASAEDAVLRDESRRLLRQRVSKLKREEQDLLALRFAAGLSSSEIARVVGRSEAAVKKQLARLLQRLREEYDNEAAHQ